MQDLMEASTEKEHFTYVQDELFVARISEAIRQQHQCNLHVREVSVLGMQGIGKPEEIFDVWMRVAIN